MNRPFFSVVIPCYNSSKTIGRMLKSIVEQQLPYGEIEVILSDDCSTESYQDIVDKFKDTLLIKQVQTDYNCCPGNTRQRGVDNATGEWVVFGDHDDQFIPGVFKKVKKLIKQNENCKYYLNTRFVKYTAKGQSVDMSPRAGWTHGKFFNLDNFWKKYNIHYIKDLKSHQDVSIISQVNYLERTEKQLKFHETNLVTYRWHENPNSLTSVQYKTADGLSRHFIDYHFRDYFDSTAGRYYDMYVQRGKPQGDKDYIVVAMVNVILYSYFYLQYALTIAPEPMIENYDYVSDKLHFLYDQFNITINDIFDFYYSKAPQQYISIYKGSLTLTYIFLCKHGLREWLDIIYNKKYLKA